MATTKRSEHSRLRSFRFLIVVELGDGRQHVLSQAADGIVANRLVDRAQAYAKAVQERPDDRVIVGIAREPSDIEDDNKSNAPLVLPAELKQPLEPRPVRGLGRLTSVRELRRDVKPLTCAVLPA